MVERVECDVLILGGGPAGLAALFWCIEYGMDPILIEKSSEFGGQLLKTYNPVTNYLGVEKTSGRDLRDRFVSQARSREGTLFKTVQITSVDLVKKTVIDAERREFRGRAMILATGVRRRSLGIPGENSFQGCGVLESGAKAGDEVKGKTVLIVGGGDAALENSLLLSEMAGKVIVVHRRREFTARKEFIDKARSTQKIELRPCSVLRSITGSDRVEAVDMQNADATERVEVQFVLIRIGNKPNSELFSGQVETDPDGYVNVAPTTATNVPGVFAAGDLTRPSAPTISTAVGQGAIAARAAEHFVRETGSKDI